MAKKATKKVVSKAKKKVERKESEKQSFMSMHKPSYIMHKAMTTEQLIDRMKKVK